MKNGGRKKGGDPAEIEGLRQRLEEAEEALRAIRNGEVDALVVPRPQGDEIFELKGAEYLYRVFVDTMNEGAATLTPKGTVLYCNNRFAGMLQTSPDRIVGSAIHRYIPAGDRKAFTSAVRRGLDETSGLDLCFRRENETLVPVHLSLNAFRGQELPVLCMVATDLTERKRAEEKIGLYQKHLRALASELALAEERERKRLAAELHDRIGQTLALAKIKLSGLLRPGRRAELTSSLAEITGLIDATIQDTHSLVFEISPPVLYQLGFEAAVEWLAEHFQRQYGIRIGVSLGGGRNPVEGDLRVVLFQALRELLVNVIKHARAGRVNIAVRSVKDRVRITVKDDGAGFSSDKYQGGGFGLFNLRERLHHLGGELFVESAIGKGTEVTLTVPRGTGAP